MAGKKAGTARKTLLTVVISIVFAVFFMWLGVRGLDFKQISHSLSRADYIWVLPSTVFGLLAYWFRAVRWNLLLEPMGYRISNSSSLWSLSFGYLMNLTIPRSGEVARSTALYGVEKVPVDKSFGTIILERAIDLICMLGFLLLTAVFKYEALQAFFTAAGGQKSETTNAGSNNKYWILPAVVVAIVVLFFAFRKRLQKLSIYAKVLQFGRGILDGLRTIFKLKDKTKFLLYTVAIWVCYYFAAYLICFSLPETADFGPADGFYIIVIGTLGMIVPASGGVGAFHFALKLGIAALFVSVGKSAEAGAEAGLSYAFISHTMQLVIMLVMGLISIPMLARARAAKN